MDAQTMLVFQQGIAAAVSTAVQQVIQGMPANTASVPVEQPSRKRMDERHFRRMKNFDGKEADWKEWKFQLRVAVRANSNDVAKVMDWVEVQTGSEIDRQALIEEFNDADYIDQLGRELYDVLCMLLSGEPSLLIQGVRDFDGFQAWHKLVRKYSPITPARSLMCMIEAVTPFKVKQLAQLPAAIERWELKVYQLEREHGEKMSGKMKTAVLTAMCPQDIQDVVFQNMEAGTEFATIRDKVRNLVANRIMSASMPVPMDIGEMEAEEGWDAYGGWWPVEGEGLENELGAVGRDCYFCGKVGHYARECPAKGFEKGQGKKGMPKGGIQG